MGTATPCCVQQRPVSSVHQTGCGGFCLQRPSPHQSMSAGVVGTSPGRMSLSGLLWARALYSRFFGCSRPCMP